jgi:hypothetical protein
MAAEITRLIDIFDRLKDEVHWSRGIVSLIAENEEAEEVIRESANCAARHLGQALSLLEELRDWQEAFEDSD